MASRDETLRSTSFGDAAAATVDPAVRMNQTRPGTMVPAPNTPSAFTQAAVAGAQAAAAARPQPPAPPRVDINAVVREQPPVMFTKGDRPFTAQSGLPPKPAAAPPTRSMGDAAGNFVVEPEGLIANLPGAAAAKPLLPEQQRSRDIINNPTQTGTVMQPFTAAQKAEGRANTLRGMYPNDVRRTGNSFEGVDVKFDGMTINGKAPGGSVNTMSAANFVQAAPSVQAQLASLRAEAADNTSFFSGRRGDLGGNQNATVMSGQTYGVLGQSGAGEMFKKQSGETNRNYRARMAAMQSEAASLRGDATTRRGQDLTQETDIRRDGTTRRGQDMDLQGRIMPKQMEMEQARAQRQRMVDTLRGATPVGKDGKPTGGINYLAAMESALANGDTATAKSISEFVEAQQKFVSGTNKISGENMERFRRFGTLRGEDGKLDEVANQDLMNSILSQRPELMTAPDPVLNRDMPAIVAEQSVLQKVNKARAEQTGWGFRGDYIPSLNSREPVAYTGQVPDSFWRGYDKVGVEGFFNGAGAEDGDVTLRSSKGTVEGRYNLGDGFNDQERAYIARRIQEANKTK